MKMKSVLFTVLLTWGCAFLLRSQTIESINSNFPLQSVILPDTKAEEWKEIRSRIRNRILATWGTSPESIEPRKNKYYIVEKYKKFGLDHYIIKYHVTANIWDKAIIVFPPDFSAKKMYKGFVAVHGSNLNLGGYQNTDLEKYPRRAYAYEMAMKGFVSIAPDHFGFGDTLGTKPAEKQKEIFMDFQKQYPEWTVVGRQMLGFIRALDVLDQLPYIEKGTYSAMGNSLGGRTSFYLAAIDERLKATVLSTGVSPFSSNEYRGLIKHKDQYATYWDQVIKKGKFPYEVQEMLALIAPRSLLILEPFNDPYNPYTSITAQAVFLAEEVWRLLNAEKNINLLIHGDGHDTVDNIRDYAYNWIQINVKTDVGK